MSQQQKLKSQRMHRLKSENQNLTKTAKIGEKVEEKRERERERERESQNIAILRPPVFIVYRVSICFFFKEPTFLERAPGGLPPIGGSPSRGARIFRASFKKKNT